VENPNLQSAAPALPKAAIGVVARPEAYRINDFAKAFGLSPATVNRMLRSGELSAVKAGGRTLIPARAAREWLASLPAWQPSVGGESRRQRRVAA
jgi:excisionase family DNA binding protein